jgi:predicted Zn-dependent protease
MVVGGQAAAAQSQLNFSRDMEREADRVGFGVSTQAGFAPAGFVSMFAKLEQASRLNDTGGFPYLRSHPLSTERMADMQSRIDHCRLAKHRAIGPHARQRHLQKWTMPWFLRAHACCPTRRSARCAIGRQR